MPGEQEAAPPTDGNGAEGWWARHPRAHPGIIVWDTSGARGEARRAGGFLRGLLVRAALHPPRAPVYGRSCRARFEVGTVAMFELRQGRAMRRNQFWVNRERPRARSLARPPARSQLTYPPHPPTHPHNKLSSPIPSSCDWGVGGDEGDL